MGSTRVPLASVPDFVKALDIDDNGVCDFKSLPGGMPEELGRGPGSPEEWLKLLKAYDF
jgi:hypothetical protein